MQKKYITPIALSLILFFLSVPAAAVKDDWINVRSKNFNLIGNASEKDIRRVAIKLEQFREAFRLLFKSKLDAPIPTNVIVFKNDRAYKPFKPKRGDGKTDDFIAGYFQPGDDVNYITLAAGGPDAETFGTIFHEYVHFIVDTNIGKSTVPAWFNEGLAEYYQTFEMEDDIKAKLGIPQAGHLELLRQSKLIPLSDFFRVTTASLNASGGHSRSIFYAQAWATMHYLMANKKSDGLDKFMSASVNGNADEKAFQNAFQMSYAQMEKELWQYVSKGSYTMFVASFEKKLAVESDMTVSPLTEAESNAFLGDLLYHNHRPDEAEPYLAAALAADPAQSMANTAMGMVKVRQRKYLEAKTFLDKAIASDPRNHMAFYQLAYLISRESRDEFGFVSGFPAEKAARMRQLLKRAIELNPTFTESYELLAFVSIVTNDQLDEGVHAMSAALKQRPGNQRYIVRIAELYLRQGKTREAGELAARVAGNAEDEDLRRQANGVLEHLKARAAVDEQNAEARKRYEAALAAGAKDKGVQPFMIERGPDGKEPTPEEVKRQSEAFEIRAINRELRKPAAAETRIIGKIEKIECKNGAIRYVVRSTSGSLTFSSRDFQSMHLSAYTADAANAEIACGVPPPSLSAVLTYKPDAAAGAVAGELVAVEFVPSHFKLMSTADAQEKEEDTIISGTPAGGAGTAEIVSETPLGSRPESIRAMMYEQIRKSLRPIAPGEQRLLGYIEKSECNNKGAFFFVRSGTQTMTFVITGTAGPELRGFTPEIENLRIGCGMKAIEVPAVVTYRPPNEKKSKTAGELVALEFVPKEFTLSP